MSFFWLGAVPKIADRIVNCDWKGNSQGAHGVPSIEFERTGLIYDDVLGSSRKQDDVLRFLCVPRGVSQRRIWGNRRVLFSEHPERISLVVLLLAWNREFFTDCRPGRSAVLDRFFSCVYHQGLKGA